MNGLAITFLAALLLDTALAEAAKLAQLRSLRTPLPPEFRGAIDQNTYRRTQDYARDRLRLGLVASGLNLVTILAFWLAGGFGWWNGVVRGIGWGAVAEGLLYVGGLAAGQALLSLPFGVYSTFVVEKRFGFNRTTPRTYILDLSKGLVLGIVLGVPLLAGVLWLLAHPSPWPFLVLWTAGVLLTVLMQYVFPIWIMPLFNTFTPLEAGAIRDAVLSYAAQTEFPIRSLFVLDGSRRSSKANAFFTGFGRNKRLALYDTLLARHPADEVVAVVAHEVGHYRQKHVLVGMLAGFAELALGVAALAILVHRPELFAAFGVTEPSLYAGLVLATLFLGPFATLISVPLLALSRRNEYQADQYAARTTGNPDAMTRALIRLAADSLANLSAARLQVWLTYSHPPMSARVSALLEHPAAADAAPPFELTPRPGT